MAGTELEVGSARVCSRAFVFSASVQGPVRGDFEPDAGPGLVSFVWLIRSLVDVESDFGLDGPASGEVSEFMTLFMFKEEPVREFGFEFGFDVGAEEGAEAEAETGFFFLRRFLCCNEGGLESDEEGSGAGLESRSRRTGFALALVAIFEERGNFRVRNTN